MRQWRPVVRLGEARVRGAAFAALAVVVLVAGCNRSKQPDGTVLDPQNEIPRGHLDMPVEGSQLPVTTTIGGWALDDRGIREIRIYVDNRLSKTATLNTERADVSKAFPSYARGTNLHGWTTSLEFYAPGPHTIVVQAVDTDGATRDIGAVNVTSIDSEK